MNNRTAVLLWPLAFAFAFLGVWEAGWLHAVLGLERFQLPVPSEIGAALGAQPAKTLRDLSTTLTAALAGLALGSALGFGVALVAALFPRWGYGGLMVVSALNAVPIVALSPIMNRWFTDGLEQKVGVVTVVTMAAMALNAYRGMTALKPFALDLMTVLAAPKRRVLGDLRLPNALPSVFTALKISIPAAMIAAIVSEYFASSTSGLGFAIKDNLRKAEMATGWAYIVVASLAGIVLYLTLLAAERALTRWHPSQAPQS